MPEYLIFAGSVVNSKSKKIKQILNHLIIIRTIIRLIVMQFQTRCTPAGWPVFSKQVQQLSECTGWLLGLAVLLITGCPKKSNFQIECSWCPPSIPNICPPPSQMDVDEPVSGNNFVGRFLLKPSRIKALAFDYKYQASQLIAQHSTVSFILINDQNFGILFHLL